MISENYYVWEQLRFVSKHTFLNAKWLNERNLKETERLEWKEQFKGYHEPSVRRKARPIGVRSVHFFKKQT